MIIEGARQDVGCGTLADRTVSAQNGDSRAGDLGNTTAKDPQVLLGAWLSDIKHVHIVCCACGDECRVVVQKLMETVHNVHPKTNGLKDESALAFRQHAACRRHSEDEVVRQISGLRKCISKVATDRNVVW